jgi:biopolymer transport protein ExbB
VPRLEQKLNLLATIAQIAPLMGLLGTVLGLMKVFRRLQEAGLNAHVSQLSDVAIPSYAGFNYLVSRINTIVLDMEQVSAEILNIVAPAPSGEPPVPSAAPK